MTRYRIALIDDQAISNFILRKLLERTRPGVEVHDFTNPVQAVRTLPDLAPDLVFLDLNMPELDGWGVLEALQNQGPVVPVVVVTSSTSDVDRQRALAHPSVRAYCCKPMNAGTLPDLDSIVAACPRA